MSPSTMNDASWATLIAMLTYKAERAGCQLIKVDPRGTSQECPECGQVAVKTLAERVHRCDCGCVLDRDVASAMVVAARARLLARCGPSGVKRAECRVACLRSRRLQATVSHNNFFT